MPTKPTKLLRSIVVVGSIGCFVLAGSFADLADATSGRVQPNRPKLVLAGRLRPATLVAPGDRIERTVALGVRGRAGLRVVRLAVTQQSASPLAEGGSGLRLGIDRCSKRWKKARGALSYTCRGKQKRVLAPAPVLGTRKLKNLRLRRGGKAYLRLTLTLPAEAPNMFQSQTTTLRYRFIGVAS